VKTIPLSVSVEAGIPCVATVSRKVASTIGPVTRWWAVIELRAPQGHLRGRQREGQDRLHPPFTEPVRPGHRGCGIPQRDLARTENENPWPIYETLTAEVHAASDHAAIYADLDI
jgi:hypothetical protein